MRPKNGRGLRGNPYRAQQGRAQAERAEGYLARERSRDRYPLITSGKRCVQGNLDHVTKALFTLVGWQRLAGQ